MPFQTERLKLRECRRIYKSLARDFYPDEIKPLWLLLLQRLRGRYDGFICRHEGEQAGYMLFMCDGKGHTLLDYYAIEPAFRAQGYGSAFFRAVCGQLSGLLLEVEDPAFALDEADMANRLRRIAFYERNGCAMTGLCSEVVGMHYRIMAGPQTRLSGPQAHAALQSLYASMFGGGWVDRYITMEECSA